MIELQAKLDGESSSGSDAGADPDEVTAVAQGSPPPSRTDEAGVGSTVSRYVVLEEAGVGGMGRVLRAYDPMLQREVALKELRRHRLDEEASQRLVVEARAMAKLSHPNVVAVYDVEELGPKRIVLVMEYVSGPTLKAWLRDADHPWQEIVARFVAAGRGLQAAHEAGLLHRDFKPANVLVSAQGTVKVTDFGLAKLGPPSSSSAESVEFDASSEDLTAAGNVMGTPLYMAPEQHTASEIGPAADQFALCVSLWTALCGTPPFRGELMARDKSQGPPPWPGAGIPRQIVHALTRGLAPRPQDRWPSMAALLEALRWDPTRRRTAVLRGAAAVAVLGGGGALYMAGAQRDTAVCRGGAQQLAEVYDEDVRGQVQAAFAGVGTAYATEAWTHTRASLDDYASAWISMHDEACEATTVRGEQSAQMMDLRMACLERAAVELDAAVQVLTRADAEVVQRAHRLTDGLRPLARCADTEALTAEVQPPTDDEARAVAALRAQVAEGRALNTAGRYEAARAVAEAAAASREAIEYAPVRTEVALLRGVVLERLGEYAASQAALEEAMRVGAQWQQWPEVRSAGIAWMRSVGPRQGRIDDAMQLVPLLEGLCRSDPEAEADFHYSLGDILRVQGKYAQAEVEYRSALSLREAAEHTDPTEVAAVRNGIATALALQGKVAKAEDEIRAVLQLREAALGPDHPEVAATRSDLGNVLHMQDEFEAAEAEHRVALQLREAVLGPDHPEVAATRNNLAATLRAQGKHAASEAQHRAALKIRESALGPEHPEVADSRHNLAVALKAQGEHDEAQAQALAALEIWESASAAPSPHAATAHFTLGTILQAEGDLGAAVAEYRLALEAFVATVGHGHPHAALCREALVAGLRSLDRLAEARTILEQAYTQTRGDALAPAVQAAASFELARLLWELNEPGDRARAWTLAGEAKTGYEAAGLDEARDEVDAWQQAHPRG